MAHASFRYVYTCTLTHVPSVCRPMHAYIASIYRMAKILVRQKYFRNLHWISITVLREWEERGIANRTDSMITPRNTNRYSFYSAFIGIRVAFLAHVNRQRNYVFRGYSVDVTRTKMICNWIKSAILKRKCRSRLVINSPAEQSFQREKKRDI